MSVSSYLKGLRGITRQVTTIISWNHNGIEFIFIFEYNLINQKLLINSLIKSKIKITRLSLSTILKVLTKIFCFKQCMYLIFTSIIVVIL